MFGIIGGLLGGWILALFNFDAVVIEGMLQLFGLAINKTGYYFLFAMMGALKSVALVFSRKPVSLDLNKEKKGGK